MFEVDLMNKYYLFVISILLSTTASSVISMQPETPRGDKPTNIPSFKNHQFIEAINSNNFIKATSFILELPSHPIAIDYTQLIQQEITETNIFYNYKNYQEAFVKPLNKENLYYFVLMSIQTGQKRAKNENALLYFKKAEERLTQHQDPKEDFL